MRLAGFTFSALALGFGAGPASASPRSIRKMDPVAIQAVADGKLCMALAHYVSVQQSYPSINDEVKRRGLKCRDELELVISNCSMLRIVGSQDVAPGAIAYTIRNASPKMKAFRIHQGGMLSSRFTIGPGEQRGYGVQSDPRLARISGIGAQWRGDGGGAESTECLTTTW
ncbi:MAG TPA: hypothetical protein VF628_07610 [Allosphingosinicella sp.]|jgi:hypothetical protein